MNAGATTERVLASLRHLLLSRAVKPGDRLDPAMLAQHLSASATPVREALHRLTGEGLVDSRAGGGFNLPLLDVTGLQNLYDWSGQLLALAIRAWPRHRHQEALDYLDAQDEPFAERCDAVFLQVGRRSLNREHPRAIHNLNVRLRHARLAESDVMDGLADEWSALMTVLRGGEHHQVLRSCATYHRRRRNLSAQIARAVQQKP